MADNFARISAEPRYVVPEARQQPVSVRDLRALAEAKRQRANANELTIAGLQQSCDAARDEHSARRDAVATELETVAALREQWEFGDASRCVEGGVAAPVLEGGGAGSKRRRLPKSAAPAELTAANTRHAAAVFAANQALKSLRAAEGALKSAKHGIGADRTAASTLDGIASEIAAAEEFVPVSLEEDAAQGVWAAPCFRWQRRGAIVPPPGAVTPALCTKASPTAKGFTPGLFVLSCPHGYIYFLKFLRRGESPQVFYEFLRDRCPGGSAPCRVCYDNGCNLDCYVAARSPELTARMVVLIDRLHARNHVHCSTCYQLDRYTDYNASLDFNTQIAEHGNRPIQRAAPSVRFSTPWTAINTLSSLAMNLASLRRQRNPALAPRPPQAVALGGREDDGESVGEDVDSVGDGVESVAEEY